MKIIKNVFKIFAIIFLIIIPICLILYSIFIDFLGCYLIFNDNSQIETLASSEGVDLEDIKIVFLDTNAGYNDHITCVNKNFIIKDFLAMQNI